MATDALRRTPVKAVKFSVVGSRTSAIPILARIFCYLKESKMSQEVMELGLVKCSEQKKQTNKETKHQCYTALTCQSNGKANGGKTKNNMAKY